MKIFLIEDNSADVRLIREMLSSIDSAAYSSESFSLVHAENITDGLNRIREMECHVILLDLSLPDSQGLNTFRKVFLACKEFPIIVLSGLDDEDLAVQAVREGAQDYLVKGQVTSQLLIRAIKYAVERKHIQDEKEKIQEKLIQSQKLEAIGRLAGGVAHDFNNLMTTIQGFSDMMMMKIEQSDPFYHPMNQIRSAASEAACLTRQILMFSRNHPIRFEPVDPNQVITELLKMIGNVVGEDIELITDLFPRINMIRSDRDTFGQMMMNLAVNAAGAMPDGGKIVIKTVNRTIRAEDEPVSPDGKSGHFVMISMSDNGIGMDQETLQHIFEPFYSKSGLGKRTGLGLSAVYGIIRQHEGWITVSSEPEKGTCFELFLPVISQLPADHQTVSLSLNALNGEGRKILIVEDSDGVREFTRLALEEHGYHVFTAAAVNEAIEIFNATTGIDLIITDVILPDKTGLDLIEYLHSQDPELKVLVSSGYTDQKTQWPVIQKMGYRVLHKPYDLSDLLNVIHEIFN